MNKIKCGRFTVGTDKYNVWIEEKTISKEGNEKTINHGYYRSLDKALQAFVHYKTLDADQKMVKHVLEDLDAALKDADEIIKAYFKEAGENEE